MTDSPRIVTLTTDFGTDDTFVGEMKGAILAVCPWAAIVDLSHAVPAHDLAAGAFVLACGTASFPDGTVHVAVVDPGVGTARRALAVQTPRAVYLAPDNGVLTRVLRREPALAIHALENPLYRRAEVSGTFEGRDVFAPAAGFVLRGEPLERLGARVVDPVLIDVFRSPGAGPLDRALVPVAHVDRFGNAILDLEACEVPVAHRERIAFVAARGSAHGLYRTYGDGPENGAFGVVNGAGYVELAVRRGRATEILGLASGDSVTVRLAPDVV